MLNSDFYISPSRFSPMSTIVAFLQRVDNSDNLQIYNLVATYIAGTRFFISESVEHKLVAIILISTVGVFTSFSAMATPHLESFSASATPRQTDPTPAACGYAYCAARWDRSKAEVGY